MTIVLMAPIANNANAEDFNRVIEDPKKQTAKEEQINKTEAILKKYTNAVYLDDQDLKELLSAVGFKGHGLKMAWAIAKAETNGRPLAFNGNQKTGDSSYGIFQINMIGELGPDRREKFDLKSNSELLNPVRNAQIAFHMSRGGEDWSAWKNGQSSRVKYFLQEYI